MTVDHRIIDKIRLFAHEMPAGELVITASQALNPPFTNGKDHKIWRRNCYALVLTPVSNLKS